MNRNGRKLLGWDEIMEGKLAPNAAVMSWRGTEAGIEAATSKLHVVMAPQQFYYLNMYQDNPMEQPKAQGGYTRLDKTYDYEPIPAAYKGSNLEKYMDGVQACVWTEFIADAKPFRVYALSSSVSFGRDRLDKEAHRLRQLPQESSRKCRPTEACGL